MHNNGFEIQTLRPDGLDRKQQMTKNAFIAGLLFLLWLDPASAESPFIRLALNEQGDAMALQVSIARYRNQAGVELDLVSAVHVGDEGYFEALNHQFSSYDSVLYELVTNDPEADLDASTPAFSMIGFMQGGMKEALGLSYQLDVIDYSQSNFVHADMTVAEFQRSMDDRGESMFKLFLRAWSVSMAQQSAGPSTPQPSLLGLLFAADRQQKLKQIMAEQLANPDQLDMLLNPEGGSTLIAGRNLKALEVMQQRISAGDQSLAIFYGAGHMPDFHDRLINEHDFEPVSTQWINAWQLN